MGRSTFRLRVEYEQPPSDDRRCGENTYNGVPLECGRQLRVARGHFFWMLKMEQFVKNWHHDPQGKRVYTMLRLRIPIMDSIRKFGLHLPQEDTSPDLSDLSSFKGTLIALPGGQTVDAQLYHDNKHLAGPWVR